MFILRLFFLISAVAAFTINHSGSNHGARVMLNMSEEVPTEARKTGVVKWFNSQKGFGFIVPDEEGPDVFVHQSSIKADGFRSLADGESVEFTPTIDDRSGKLKATSVTGPGGVAVQGAPYEPRDEYY
eukprot:CAMPEP_0119552546 /NCGR_PEP_ID=MMETSP1352-20130426/5495_1 /TAXON_ID=265584 /ORGANISM="Stauroneis constricta, Strain CCMP1120" /LENGTH=127 /DNA_ID=CAMNT_0007598789 /DNA_START=64 /DNA_END=447 /DNA_ORIENTATION=-